MTSFGTGELLKDRYRLERTLGRGGMAAVWLGHDEVLERPVAVKVLSDTIASDQGFVARFRREAQTAAGLSHPNLVGVYDFSEEGERPYLVMQFVPGENLAERLERGRGIDGCKLARELLDALAHIHGVGILHRDVKPANIVIEPEGTAKLIDFGIALPRDATALTSTGLVLGTERYAAPEVMEGEPASERSDLYSLGVVLRSCQEGGSAQLADLVEWLTAREPRDRPASAQQAQAALDRSPPAEPEQTTQVFEPTRPIAVEPTGPIASGRREPRVARKGALIALLAFVAALAAVAVIALAGGGDDQQTPAPQTAKKGAKANKSAEPAAKTTAAAAPEEEAEEPAPEPEAAPEAEPEAATEAADSGSGASLNEQGYELIQAGDYEAAVPVLEGAVAAYPEGSEDLDYAYALFNLGSALRLSGRPEEAIPVLEQRLQIPNQTATVEQELEAARAEAG
ncbi:MAG TPA: serine/threonine-protein kinase [Solirubrobacterales bacterium]